MAIKRERATVTVVGYDDVYFDGKNIEQAIEYLKHIEKYALQKLNLDPYDVVKMYFDFDYCGYDGGYTLRLMVERKETDAEYNKRIEKLEKEAERNREARERKKEEARKVLLKTQDDEKKLLKELIDKHGIPTD